MPLPFVAMVAAPRGVISRRLLTRMVMMPAAPQRAMNKRRGERQERNHAVQHVARAMTARSRDHSRPVRATSSPITDSAVLA